MHLVLSLERRKKKTARGPRGGIDKVVPLGTSFALSENFIFTACHNVLDGNAPLSEIGLVKEYDEYETLESDIILATLVSYCADEDEDWAIYERSPAGRHFPHFARVCGENELPKKNERIGIHDFVVGLVSSETSSKLTPQSFRTKVSQYEQVRVTGKKRKRHEGSLVVSQKTLRGSERGLQVVGGRVKGSCGAAYFAVNGKVVAFHVASLDDGESVSAANSYTSDRSHTSFSLGLVLCRLPKFRIWYNTSIPAQTGDPPL